MGAIDVWAQITSERMLAEPWMPLDFVHFMKTSGSSRVMFGTNWPMISPADCLKSLDSLNLTGQQQQAFLSGNAKRGFGL